MAGTAWLLRPKTEGEMPQAVVQAGADVWWRPAIQLSYKVL
jgi:hypothetical protein